MVNKNEEMKKHHPPWCYSISKKKCNEKLKTVKFDEDTECSICYEDCVEGYTGDCTCLEKFKSKPDTCQECVILQVMRYKMQYVLCHRCKQPLFK